MVLARHSARSSYEGNLLLRSQAQSPQKIFEELLVTAIKDSWIIAIINLHVAVFFGLILLASGYDEFASLTYLGIQLGVSTIVGIILIFLVSRPSVVIRTNQTSSYLGLITSDSLLAGGWGFSILIFFMTASANHANMLVALLLAAGISTAAMSAKLLWVLVSGRIIVFLPTILFLVLQQPQNWLLHTTSLVVAFAVCLAVGYAIHVQLLREASLIVELNQTQKKIVREADFREHYLKAITHDLRQPISATKLFFRRLKRTQPELDNTSESRAIDDCLNTAGAIIDDIAQLSWVDSKLPEVMLQPVEVQELIDRVVQVNQGLADKNHVQLESTPSTLLVNGDAVLLERALGNLVKNAIDHANASKVSIHATSEELSNKVRITVADNGNGIARAEQNAIFEEFNSGDKHGAASGHMGIGLSIVRSIAEAHQGEIALRSAVDQGSSFTLTLNAPISNEKRKAQKFERIIIIDDDEHFANEISARIRQRGVQATIFTSDAQIQSCVEATLPVAEAYIVDYRLGNSFTGEDVLKRLPKKAKKYLISDSDDPSMYSLAAHYSAEFISKPSLLHKLHQLF